MAEKADLIYYFKGTIFGFRSLLVILLFDLWYLTSNHNVIAALACGISVIVFESLRYPQPFGAKLLPMLMKGLIAALAILPVGPFIGGIAVVGALATMSLVPRPKGVGIL